jgi:two-component system, sensor histidine kinase LadS
MFGGDFNIHILCSRYIKIILVIIIFLFLIVQRSVSADVIIVDKANQDFIFTEKNFDIVPDKNSQYGINEIASKQFSVRFDTSKIMLNHEDLYTPYWYRFSVKNLLGEDKQLIFELLNFQLDQVILYIPDKSGGYIEYQSGDIFPFSLKRVDHKNFLFLLPSADTATVINCYLRIEIDHKIVNRARAVVRSEERFISYALKEYYFLGIFYGILFIMMIYNLILYITIRSSSYIYYVLYILSVAFYSLSWNGLGFQYLWPAFPGFNFYALPVASYSLVLWASLYAKSFLLTSERAKILDKIFIAVIFIRTLIFIAGILISKSFLYLYLIDIIPLVLGFVAGIISLINDFRPAKYFIVAYSSLFVGFGILTLHQQGIFPANVFTVYSLELGVVIELTFFSVALADRYKLLKASEESALELVIVQLQENEKLKDKVNKELEAKVMERTLELEEANEKLNVQAGKINKMNLMLDLDNRKLQKDVKDLYSARVFGKELSREEFTNLYPDADACYKYLSFLKWDESYNCKKCGNDKFFWGKAPFSRRCTKCGYEESVTAHTIFHNMRIPVEKAFYIVFLIYSGNEKISSTELSRILMLRQKTCWEYKKSISGRILQKKQELKTDKLEGWDKLILD